MPQLLLLLLLRRRSIAKSAEGARVAQRSIRRRDRCRGTSREDAGID